jgi:hypothetical protein
MARIETKKKEKLSNIGSWIIIGILSAVVITGIVLTIIYFVGLNNADDEKSFDEQYPEANLITWEDLDDVLNPYTISDIQVNGEIYVLVYSPDYETYPDGEKISDKVNACIDAEVDTLYVLNVEAEDNKDSSASAFEYLSDKGLPSGYPYLLVITSENGIIEIAEDGIITTRQEINNKLTDIIG